MVVGVVEELEQRALRGVVGAGGITKRGADTAIGLGEDLGLREGLGLAVAPVEPGLTMQPFGAEMSRWSIGRRGRPL